ncbi:MAG: TIGR02996 domain-containing protein [Polyangiales bacterium]
MNRARRELIEAIRRSPAADGPRLDAAKWFEQQGDPASVARAEFIRVQLERARLSSHDPAQHELAARELRLLRQWSAQWASAHPGLRKISYRRGFAEYAHIHARTFLPWRKQLFALEPVRDVRLTGLYRPERSIIEAVARCDEWKHVETLRFHHQGPHHEPRQELLAILESPKLSNLRALYGTRFQMNAEGRRRIERLSLLERLETLAMPSFDTFPDDPGEWFSEGEVDASGWSALRSFTAPYSYASDELARWWGYPWFSELTSLSCSGDTDSVPALVERLPRGLRSFEGYFNSYRFNERVADDLFDRWFDALIDRPLRALNLSFNQAEGFDEAFTRALRRAPNWSLSQLFVPQLDADTLTVLADAPSTRHLRSLSATADLAALSLLGQCDGPALETLALAVPEVDSSVIVRALAAPMARSVSWLTLTGLALDHALADALCAMEHVAVLRLQLRSAQPSAIEKLESHFGARAWLSIERDDEPWPEDEGAQRAILQRDRAARAPERMPPLDAFVPRL